MNDAEIAQIYPTWATLSKRKKDEIFHEFQERSFRMDAEFQEIERRADILEREHLLSSISSLIQLGNAMQLFRMIEEEFEERKESMTEEEQVQFSLDLWDRASLASLNALDTRNDFMALSLVVLFDSLVVSVGRAAVALQKSPKFPPFYLYCLRPTASSPLAAVPIQSTIARLLQNLLWNPKPTFVQTLVDSGILSELINQLAVVCPSVLAHLCGAIEFIMMRLPDCNYDPSLVQKAQVAASVRLLKTDVRQSRVRMNMQAQGWTDIGEVLSPLVGLLQVIAYTFRIPVSDKVRKHIEPFGAGYTEREPTDPVERARWTPRYVCKRVAEEDWTTPISIQRGQLLTQMNVKKLMKMDEKRMKHIQCAACHKTDDEDQKLNKCARCKRTYYCSRDCQTEHWKIHKATCSKADRTSVPETLLSFEQMTADAYNKLTAGGYSLYPCLFVAWLDDKYNKN